MRKHPKSLFSIGPIYRKIIFFLKSLIDIRKLCLYFILIAYISTIHHKRKMNNLFYVLVIFTTLGCAYAATPCGGNSGTNCPIDCVLMPVVVCVGESDSSEGFYATFNTYSSCTDYIINLGDTENNRISLYERADYSLIVNSTESPITQFPASNFSQETQVIVHASSKSNIIVWYLRQFQVTARWTGLNTCNTTSATVPAGIDYSLDATNNDTSCTLPGNGHLRNMASGYNAVVQVTRDDTTGNATPCINAWIDYNVASQIPNSNLSVCVASRLNAYGSIHKLACQAAIEQSLVPCCEEVCIQGNCSVQQQPQQTQQTFSCNRSSIYSENVVTLLGECYAQQFGLDRDCNSTTLTCLSGRFGSSLFSSEVGQDLYVCGFNKTNWSKQHCGIESCYQEVCGSQRSFVPVSQNTPTSVPRAVSKSSKVVYTSAVMLAIVYILI